MLFDDVHGLNFLHYKLFWLWARGPIKFGEEIGFPLVNEAHDTAGLAGLLGNSITMHIRCYVFMAGNHSRYCTLRDPFLQEEIQQGHFNMHCSDYDEYIPEKVQDSFYATLELILSLSSTGIIHPWLISGLVSD